MKRKLEIVQQIDKIWKEMKEDCDKWNHVQEVLSFQELI